MWRSVQTFRTRIEGNIDRFGEYSCVNCAILSCTRGTQISPDLSTRLGSLFRTEDHHRRCAWTCDGLMFTSMCKLTSFLARLRSKSYIARVNNLAFIPLLPRGCLICYLRGWSVWSENRKWRSRNIPLQVTSKLNSSVLFPPSTQPFVLEGRMDAVLRVATGLMW